MVISRVQVVLKPMPPHKIPRFEMTYLLYPLVIVVAIFAAVVSAASYTL